MKTHQAGAGMADTRAKGIVAASFVGGLLLAAWVFAPDAWEPVPEPYFGLEEPVEAATPLPRQAAAPLPKSPPTPSQTPPPVGGLSSMAAAMPAVVRPDAPPERLALSEAPPAVSEPPRPADRAIAQSLPPRAPATNPAANPSEHPESLRLLVTRVQMRRVTAEEPVHQKGRDLHAGQPERIETPVVNESLGAAPLPGQEWTDPDSVNWTDAERHEHQKASKTPGGDASAASGRLIDRLRAGDRLLPRSRRDEPPAADRMAMVNPPSDVRSPGSTWPHPQKLLADLQQLASSGNPPGPHQALHDWSNSALTTLTNVLATTGPRDPSAAPALLRLGDAVHEGMSVADRIAEGTLSSQTRRAALAISRRVAIWRAAAGMLAPPVNAPPSDDQPRPASHDPLVVARSETDVARLLDGLERYEMSLTAADAATVKEAMRAAAASPMAGSSALARAVTDHYLSPNIRIAVHGGLVEKLAPDREVKTGPVDEVIAGRQVRGIRTVTQNTTIRFVPDPDEIAMDLEVQGEVTSRSVTDAGPVSLTSRGTSNFMVRKPIKVSPHGLLFGPAAGSASNNSQLAGIQTSFDSVPVMRSLVRQLARSQHDDNLPDINREVIEKIVSKACRETDAQSELKFVELSDRIRTKVWMPMVKLGLKPTPVALESTQSTATLRLRLAADTQLAAHTPRPRAPVDAALSVQVHESSMNNALERLALAGRRLPLEDLYLQCCERLGLEPKLPDDLPKGVEVTFARAEPLRIACSDGLVRVRVALEALESGRRNWYDVIAQVTYRPAMSGAQVFLERDGPIQISGPGHQGRMELALRTIFGKVFPKERPVAVLPERIANNPRLEAMRAVQAVSSDGWFAIAIASREPPASATSSQETSQEAKRPVRFR
ncbi:MAG: hypothetical protein ACKOEX_08910 [Planctomycetia bacterium]